MSTLEPWLQGSLQDVPAIPRAVLHALELAQHDLEHWCKPLSDAQLNRSSSGVPSVAFHIRHIVGSIDRLLTYAEGRQLSEKQMQELVEEHESISSGELFATLASSLKNASARVRALDSSQLEEARKVGRKERPTTLGGLLVHVAEHTQRHVGQAIVTAKIVRHPALGI
jgi:uncharacterized damage-inducible protein DinB